MFSVLLGFITALCLTYVVIPVIIRIARNKKLYDRPNERSAHFEPTPSLGGIAIFGGAVCATVVWTPPAYFGQLQYVLAAFIIIFLIGVKDDLSPLSPLKKLAGQLLAALILVYQANLRISSLYGILGVQELPDLFSFLFSIIVIVGIMNAFNLIDGINGLAGSVGLLACFIWGCWFYAVGEMAFCVLSFALAGALVAFLKFNVTPARIFMGDTGSLLVGTVCAVLAIKFIELQRNISVDQHYALHAAPAIAIGILILPLFDTVRVLCRRIWLGYPPFRPDRSHIHHMLLDLGLSHMQATTLLLGVNLFFITGAFVLSRLGNMALLVLELGCAMVFSSLLYRMALRRKIGGY